MAVPNLMRLMRIYRGTPVLKLKVPYLQVDQILEVVGPVMVVRGRRGLSVSWVERLVLGGQMTSYRVSSAFGSSALVARSALVRCPSEELHKGS